MKLHPEQVLEKDDDGNVPIHIITVFRELSDIISFLCFDCFTNKSELLNIEYDNGTSKYYCLDCLEWKSKILIDISFKIKPGKLFSLLILKINLYFS